MKFSLALSFVLLPVLLNAAETVAPITDPVRDFLASFEVKHNRTVVHSSPDLNGDGIPDVLITCSDFANGRQGNIWVYYESTGPGTFRRIDELSEGVPIEFHQKAVSFRPRRDGKGVELVRYSPGGAGEGTLTVFRLGNGGGTEAKLDELRPRDDPGRYSSLFETPKTQLAFAEEESNVLLARYYPMGRWFLHMTPMKWAIAIIGGLALLVVLLSIVRVFMGLRRGPAVPR